MKSYPGRLDGFHTLYANPSIPFTHCPRNLCKIIFLLNVGFILNQFLASRLKLMTLCSNPGVYYNVTRFPVHAGDSAWSSSWRCYIQIAPKARNHLYFDLNLTRSSRPCYWIVCNNTTLLDFLFVVQETLHGVPPEDVIYRLHRKLGTICILI